MSHSGGGATYSTHGSAGIQPKNCQCCSVDYVPIMTSGRLPVCGKCLAEFKLFVQANNKSHLLDRDGD